MITVLLFQATEEKIEMTALQNNNKQILCNLLPAHVAAHCQIIVMFIYCYDNSFTISGHGGED